MNENVTVTSEGNNYSRSAAMSCWWKVFSYIREKYRLEESLILRFWSDFSSGQFCSRCGFSLLSRFVLVHTIFRFYNECHHGKELMDGVGGTIKNQVFRDVISGKVSVTNAEHFAAHAHAILNGIKSLSMSIDEVLKDALKSHLPEWVVH